MYSLEYEPLFGRIGKVVEDEMRMKEGYVDVIPDLTHSIRKICRSLKGDMVQSQS